MMPEEQFKRHYRDIYVAARLEPRDRDGVPFVNVIGWAHRALVEKWLVEPGGFSAAEPVPTRWCWLEGDTPLRGMRDLFQRLVRSVPRDTRT